MSGEPETLEEKLERLSEGIPNDVRELRQSIHWHLDAIERHNKGDTLDDRAAVNRHIQCIRNEVDKVVDVVQKQILVDDLEDEQ